MRISACAVLLALKPANLSSPLLQPESQSTARWLLRRTEWKIRQLGCLVMRTTDEMAGQDIMLHTDRV